MGSNLTGRVAQIGLTGKKKVQSSGDVLTECSHHDGRTKERAAALNYAVNLEKRVRANHPLRQVKAAIDLVGEIGGQSSLFAQAHEQSS